MAATKSVKMSWSLKKWKSARVVSHRASPMGEEHPDTCYRQVVVRLESVQHTRMTPKSVGKVAVKGRMPAWAPDAVRASGVSKESSKSEEYVDETKDVVDYFVMQQRVVHGKLEKWKAWGFTTASTPETIKDDDEYWRKAVEIQTANAA
jgi:protein MBA1